MFIWEWARQRVQAGRAADGEGEVGFPIPSQDPETLTWPQTKSHVLNRLSHQGSAERYIQDHLKIQLSLSVKCVPLWLCQLPFPETLLKSSLCILLDFFNMHIIYNT